MIGLGELLKEEKARLSSIQNIINERLSDAPEGTLRITSCRKEPQFMVCKKGSKKSKRSGEYIKKSEFQLVNQLAQKAYDKKIKRIVDRRLVQLGIVAEEYRDTEIEDIYLSLSAARKQLVTPVEPTWHQRLSQWKSIPYEGKGFKEGQIEIYSKKGERVRSKSEKILADMFYDMGIEYKYECPINLKGYGTVYPDFTFLSPRTYEEIYWEHDGRMDEPEYAEKAIRKVDTYSKNGILPGKRLIVTYESSNYALNTAVAEILAKEYLL